MSPVEDFRCSLCILPSKQRLGYHRAIPPLAGSKWATSDPALISYIILNGLKGEIVVKGETYGTTAAVNMAAVPISNREIANVTTYVRQAWGNDASEITTEEVEQFRNDTNGRQEQWTGDELVDLFPSVFSTKSFVLRFI